MARGDTDTGSKLAALWEAFDDAVQDGGFEVEGYEVLEELDQGGMGAVYRARQLEPDREVALKVMLPRYGGEPEMRRRFQTEARAMAALDHPGVLPVYEVGESCGLPFFSMKLAAGGDLSSRLARGAMPPAEAVAIACEIGDAVHYAHLHGVLHLDLKPGNFLFGAGGRVYVSDFGVAKLLAADGSLTRTQSLVGTPYYMPPEVAGGSATEASVAGDLYSLGAVFYECLTGKRPHASHKNVASLLRAIVDEEIAPVRTVAPGVPGDLAIICMKALEEDPAARYPSVAHFVRDLRRWRDGHPISARPAGTAEKAWRWACRHPLPSALAGGLVATAVTGAALLSTSYRETRKQLHGLLVAQAEAARVSFQPGFRDQAFSLLDRATAIAASPEIRDGAIALLAKRDFSPSGQVPMPPPETAVPAGWTARTLPGGTLELHPSGGGPGRQWQPSPGQRVVLRTVPGSGGSPASVVVAGTDSAPALYTGARLEERRPLPATGRPSFVEVSPGGEFALFGGAAGAEIVPLATHGSPVRNSGGAMRCPPAWSPDGQVFAASLGERKQFGIYDGDTAAARFVLSTSGWPEQLTFHPGGQVLAVSCRDGALELYDLPSKSLIAEIGVEAQDTVFSQDGTTLHFRTRDGLWKAWDVHSPVGFREWDPTAGPATPGTVFDARLSPDGTLLATSTTAGIGLWSVGAGRLEHFFPVENQRLDSRTSAWWLSDDNLLIQVPGALETLAVLPGPALAFRGDYPHPPGSTVLDVLPDGRWLVETYGDDEVPGLFFWAGGDPGRATPVDGGPPAAPAAPATITDRRTVTLAGDQPLTLTPPNPVRLVLVIPSKDGNHIFAIGEDHRVLDWDVEKLATELVRRGFE